MIRYGQNQRVDHSVFSAVAQNITVQALQHKQPVLRRERMSPAGWKIGDSSSACEMEKAVFAENGNMMIQPFQLLGAHDSELKDRRIFFGIDFCAALDHSLCHV